MEMRTSITGRRRWCILTEMPSMQAALLYIDQNPGKNLKIETIQLFTLV